MEPLEYYYYSDPTPTPTTAPTNAQYIYDDTYVYNDDGLRVSEYWSKNVITTFLVFFVVTWILDLLGVSNDYIRERAFLANHRVRLERGKINPADSEGLVTHDDLPDTITAIAEKDKPKMVNKTMFLFYKCVEYQYCPSFKESLLTERLYYTGDKKADLIFYLCNTNAFLSMFCR